MGRAQQSLVARCHPSPPCSQVKCARVPMRTSRALAAVLSKARTPHAHGWIVAYLSDLWFCQRGARNFESESRIGGRSHIESLLGRGSKFQRLRIFLAQEAQAGSSAYQACRIFVLLPVP